MKGLLDHVPEGMSIQAYTDYYFSEEARDAELAELLPELAGNKIFTRSRGTWRATRSDHADRLFREFGSTTQVKNALEQSEKDYKIMMSFLGRLLAKGHEHAYRHMVCALQDASYLLPNETFPLDEVELVTGVMFEPETTLLFLEAITRADLRVLSLLSRGDDPEKVRWNANERFERDIEISEKLFKALPSIETCLGYEMKEWYTGSNKPSPWPAQVMAAYLKDVLSKFFVPDKCRGRFPRDVNGKFFTDKFTVRQVLSRWSSGDVSRLDEWWFELPCSVFFLRRGEQSEVLSRYSRDEQKHIATWQFHVPKFLSWSYKNIGLHREDEHADFRKKKPALVSRGINSGFGSMVLTDADHEQYQKFSYLFPTDQPLRFNMSW